MLQSNEEGTIEVFFDTSRFRGAKTSNLYLHLDNGQRREVRFTVTADSQDAAWWRLWKLILQSAGSLLPAD